MPNSALAPAEPAKKTATERPQVHVNAGQLRAAGQGGYQILKHIASKREFREYQQIHPILPGLFSKAEMFFEVGLHVP